MHGVAIAHKLAEQRHLKRPEREINDDGNTALDMLARFPAGMHRKAHHSHDAPPHWPVSGLAKTTRIPFPGRRFRGVHLVGT
jgi:hypothetical protein